MAALPGPVLITGGAGFVGRHLTRAVLEAWPQAQIHWFSRDEGKCASSQADDARVFAVTADLGDEAAVEAAVKAVQPAIVLHLAAQSSVAQSGKAAAETWKANVVGSYNLAAAIAGAAPGANLIFAGSADVYGLACNAGDVTEETPPQPQNVYARSKLSAEAVLADVLPSSARLVTLRPANHTGPGHDERFALPSFAAQIARIEAGLQQPVLEIGNLDVFRDFLDVADVTDAYVAVIAGLAEQPGRALYNIGSGRAHLLRGLLDAMLSRASQKIEVRISPDRWRENDVPRVCVRPEKLASATGWSARRDMDFMTARLLDYWRARVAAGQGGG